MYACFNLDNPNVPPVQVGPVFETIAEASAYRAGIGAHHLSILTVKTDA